MKDLLLTLAHLLATLAKLPEPGGARAIVADSLLPANCTQSDTYRPKPAQQAMPASLTASHYLLAATP